MVKEKEKDSDVQPVAVEQSPVLPEAEIKPEADNPSDIPLQETEVFMQPDNNGVEQLIAFFDQAYPEQKDVPQEEKLSVLREQLESNRLFHEKMSELFDSEPVIGNILSDVMHEKKGFFEAMAEFISPEEYADLIANSGGDVKAAHEARRNQINEQRTKEATLANNTENSAATIQAWLTKKEWKQEKEDDFLNKLEQVFTAVQDGVFTEQELDSFERMFYSDELINNAREEAAIAARDGNMAKEVLKKEADAAATDGLPDLNGVSAATPAKTSNPFSDVFELHKSKKKLY